MLFLLLLLHSAAVIVVTAAFKCGECRRITTCCFVRTRGSLLVGGDGTQRGSVRREVVLLVACLRRMLEETAGSKLKTVFEVLGNRVVVAAELRNIEEVIGHRILL